MPSGAGAQDRREDELLAGNGGRPHPGQRRLDLHLFERQVARHLIAQQHADLIEQLACPSRASPGRTSAPTRSLIRNTLKQIDRNRPAPDDREGIEWYITPAGHGCLGHSPVSGARRPAGSLLCGRAGKPMQRL
jgi:hypothetical protein